VDTVRRDDHPPACHFFPNHLDVQTFSLGTKFHLGGDFAGTGGKELGLSFHANGSSKKATRVIQTFISYSAMMPQRVVLLASKWPQNGFSTPTNPYDILQRPEGSGQQKTRSLVSTGFVCWMNRGASDL
jgi:hypothetical protein